MGEASTKRCSTRWPTPPWSRTRRGCASHLAATRTSKPSSTVARRLSQAEENMATARQMLTEASGEDRDVVNAEIESSRLRGRCSSKKSSASCWCRRTPTTAATSSSRSVAPKAVRRRTCSPRTCSRCTGATPSARGWKLEVLSSDPSDRDGLNEVTFMVKGPDAWSPLEARRRDPPRPACAGDRVPGPDPHLGGDGDGSPRGRRGRGVHRSGRPAGRRVPLDRARADSR